MIYFFLLECDKNSKDRKTFIGKSFEYEHLIFTDVLKRY